MLQRQIYGQRSERSSRLKYCVGWVRQLENMCLALPPEIANKLPERVRELVGYSIHPPFMGHVDGLHPKRLLQAE
jgi:ectoine hydroxylase-related dioxygenase (phytanoyl-CoA dioxygenase family)